MNAAHILSPFFLDDWHTVGWKDRPGHLEPVKAHFLGVSGTMLILDSNITPKKPGEGLFDHGIGMNWST